MIALNISRQPLKSSETYLSECIFFMYSKLHISKSHEYSLIAIDFFFFAYLMFMGREPFLGKFEYMV